MKAPPVPGGPRAGGYNYESATCRNNYSGSARCTGVKLWEAFGKIGSDQKGGAGLDMHEVPPGAGLTLQRELAARKHGGQLHTEPWRAAWEGRDSRAARSHLHGMAGPCGC
ncbi:hypothetical protein NDU88_007197 [Pleurodeles waltl]|uniref:Uncharacterized protein n=1 Tax=Pleurodeles waltl TaxID=8319 RepID=A0AAV7NSZ2_PLEWA|nr:hypothetical protein NDU88_007197 [Pleurodeles waltl]